MLLDNYTLWIKCAEWGSYITNTDPGACMYGFNETSGFQNRTHAKTVLEHVKDCCLPIAVKNKNDDDIEDLENIMETAAAFL